MDDVEDLLAPGTLSGQDGAWREDLDGASGHEPSVFDSLNVTMEEVWISSYHGAYRL